MGGIFSKNAVYLFSSRSYTLLGAPSLLLTSRIKSHFGQGRWLSLQYYDFLLHNETLGLLFNVQVSSHNSLLNLIMLITV